jgi:hypothetical protein
MISLHKYKWRRLWISVRYHKWWTQLLNVPFADLSLGTLLSLQCKIWGFHGGDYEECRLLGYKNPVHTSQKTYYVSATGPSRLILCKNRGFNGGDYENAVFWDITPCGSCKNRRFGGTYRLIIRVTRIGKGCGLQLLVSDNVVPSLPIHVSRMMETIYSSETLVLTIYTRHNIPEDGILQVYTCLQWCMTWRLCDN